MIVVEDLSLSKQQREAEIDKQNLLVSNEYK